MSECEDSFNDGLVKTEEISDDSVDKTIEQCPTVSPILSVEDNTGWYDSELADHFVSVPIVVSIEEKPDKTTYDGQGTLSVTSGKISIFTDDKCKNLLTDSYSAEALRTPQTVYVKGGAVGAGTVQLKLNKLTADPNITVKESDSQSVTIKAVNVIKPVIDAESKVVLFFNQNPLPAKPTSLTEITIKFDQSNKRHKCNDSLKAKLIYDTGKLICYKKDAEIMTEYESGKEFTYSELTGDQLLKLYFKGKGVGEGVVKLESVIPEGLDESFRVLAKDECPLAVVKLEIEVYTHLSALSYEGDEDDTVSPDNKVSEGRYIHYQDDNKFKRAQILLKNPGSLLWQYGSDDAKIILSAEKDTTEKDAKKIIKTIKFCKTEDDALPLEKLVLSKTDFNDDDISVWIEVTGDTSRDKGDNIEGKEGFNPDFDRLQILGYDQENKGKRLLAYHKERYDTSWQKWEPEQLIAPCHLHVGATVKTEGESDVTLKYGDCTKLKAHSFDREIDRAARNKCHERIRAVLVDKAATKGQVSKKDVAIAYAGLHETYYDFREIKGTHSIPHMNHNYPKNTFTGFIKAIKPNGVS